CANTAERDAAQAEDRRGALRGALAEAEFPDEASATAALLSAPEIKRLAQAVDAHDKEFAQVSRDVSELTRELDGKRVTAETLDHLEGVASERQAAHHDALSRHAAGEKELERLKEDVAHVAEIRAQLKEARDRWNIQRQLADDLRNDRFQAWVLEEILHSIVRGASERLAGLTNRYALEMHNDDFYVIDNDNAGERRIAHTLSGGETFLTSLALALELSEQVQANAGAVRLDSLFIDEGFGTLDAETLDTVAGVLESLTVGGRMVGIITHISELSQRLPARLRVQKGAEGTKILAEA
ncbi:MAG: hypothetical protein FJX76_20885, partial [Armatimonadetes bacterium]|nr:hypothetical protein [Armatimonadota bacterium]